MQREAVVRGDEVDAGVRPRGRCCRTDPLEPVRRRAKSPISAAVAFPVRAHRVAVLVVPLGPADREVADLVAALAQVPRLGDQLDLRQHRVLAQDVEERAETVDVVQLARQRRGEVEAEAVDVHLADPVAQRVHHQLQHARVQHVERVAAAGEVHVVARRVGRQPVVGRRCRCRGSDSVGPSSLPSAVWL